MVLKVNLDGEISQTLEMYLCFFFTIILGIVD